MRSLLLAIMTASVLSGFAPGHGAEAAPFIASSAYGLSVDLMLANRTVQYGPVGNVAGGAPPAYDETRTAARASGTLAFGPGSSINPTLQIDAADIATRAASQGFGVDFVSAHGGANISSVGLVLATNPRPPIGLLGLLGLSLSATDVHSTADFSTLFGANHNFATGDASFGSLTLGGSLIGSTLTFSGQAAANTILFSNATSTVTLDKQLPASIISCTINVGCANAPASITTDAIDIHLHNARLFGGVISGDVVVGQSFAGLPSAGGQPASVPEPASLLLLSAGFMMSLAAVRHRSIGGDRPC